MKRAIGIVISSVIFLIVSNIYYYHDTYTWQIDTQKTILKKQISICSKDFKNFFSGVKNDILLLINESELIELFEHSRQSDVTQKRIEILCNRYNSIVKKVNIIDIKGNYYALKKSTNNTYISQFGKSARKEDFKPTITTDSIHNELILSQPLYGNSHIYGYVVFHIDINSFYKQLFKNFYLKGHQFQWITDQNNNIIYSTIPNLAIKAIDPQLSNIKKSKTTSSVIHFLSINNTQQKTLTVIQDIKYANHALKMAFSIPIKPITNSILKNSFLVGLISFVVIILIVIAFFQYILKTKSIQKRLSQSENALKKILYFAPVGIVLVDNFNNIKLVNKSALKIFECNDEGLLLDQECTEKVLFERKKKISRTNVSNTSRKYIFNNSKQKKQVILSEKIPFFNQTKKYHIHVFIEITPIEMDRIKEEKSNKAKSTFVANISHELRTPLNGIIGMTDIMSSSNNIPETEMEMLSVVKRSADTLLALINDILDFSKIEAGKLEVESIPVDLKYEIEQSISGLTPLSKDRNINLNWVSTIDLPNDLITDPLRLRQVLNNLIGNAIKFTPSGQVQLKISQGSTLNGNPALKFTISDTGIGIKKEKLKTIFNSFSQEDDSTTRKFGGTGLGTSISKNLIELMGGEIWANSPSSISTSPDHPGAEFNFTLPLETRLKSKDLDFSYILSWAQIEVLIICDDILQVQNTIKNLLALGIRYKIMAPSQEAIQMLSEQNTIHMIIIDQRPDFNGLDFLQQLYNHHLYKKHLIIIQSSDYETMNTKLGRKLGTDAYLRKPVKLENIRSFILKHFTSIKSQTSLAGQIVPDDIKILVAEDNLFNQKVAQNLFRKIGYEIELANNGREAINKFKEHKHHIVFMDLMMPELDGFDAAKELKCYDENCPVIAMTANNDKTQRELAFKAGMDDFIVKPAQKEEISRMIIKWCSL